MLSGEGDFESSVFALFEIPVIVFPKVFLLSSFVGKLEEVVAASESLGSSLSLLIYLFKSALISAFIGLVRSSLDLGLISYSLDLGLISSSFDLSLIRSSLDKGLISSSFDLGITSSSFDLGITSSSFYLG